jgi:integrase
LAVTGLRISETVGLRWKHLDLGEHPHVKVREQHYKGQRKPLKSREGRRDVPLTASMAERLLEHRRDTFAGAEAPVFPSRTGTELLPANVYRRALAPTAIELGHSVEVTGANGKRRMRSTVSFHTFRHTCASLLFAQGRNVRQVAAFLGHADPSFTLRI